jgi:asparagine synthase (glutamine-hydrolysing)
MCGIFGYFQRKGQGLTASQLEQMQRRLFHRGPDGQGLFDAVAGMAIGNNRLAIIDVEGGQQPVISADGRVGLVQNGEIYNYIELREELIARGVQLKTHSDTEVLLHLYLEFGPEFVHKLSGMYTIAIADVREGCMWLYRDPMGVKPLFITENEGTLLFASEIKALLDCGIPRKVDTEALHHYMTFGYVPAPWTMFQGVRHLMPGHRMRITKDAIKTDCWFDLSQQESAPITQDEFNEKFISLMRRSVELRMRADVPFGAFLSGGLDSSTVVALMQQQSDTPIRTFAIGFEDVRFDESKFAQMAADRFGTNHSMEVVGPDIVSQWGRTIYYCDQPHSDVSFLPYNQLAKSAVRDKQVKMVLTGDGGDELFGGYQHYTDFFAKNPNLTPPQMAERYLGHRALIQESEKQNLYSADLTRQTAGLNTVTVAQSWLDKVQHWDLHNQAMWLDVSLLLPGNNLVKPDRMTMAESLEARDPFLDKDLAEFAFTVRGDFKIQHGEPRYAYKQAVKNLLGDELTFRKKSMFTVPIGEWFKSVLRPATEVFLSPKRIESRGLFNPDAVQKMLHDHFNDIDHTRQLRQLIALELWHLVFIDQAEISPENASSLINDALLASTV